MSANHFLQVRVFKGRENEGNEAQNVGPSLIRRSRLPKKILACSGFSPNDFSPYTVSRAAATLAAYDVNNVLVYSIVLSTRRAHERILLLWIKATAARQPLTSDLGLL